MLGDHPLAFADSSPLFVPASAPPDDPYLNLLRALLLDAIDSATGHPRLDLSDYRHAQSWLRSKTDD